MAAYNGTHYVVMVDVRGNAYYRCTTHVIYHEDYSKGTHTPQAFCLEKLGRKRDRSVPGKIREESAFRIKGNL